MYGYDTELTFDQLQTVVPRTILTRLILSLEDTIKESSSVERLQPWPLPPSHRRENFTWLPTLNTKMPHLWCQGERTSPLVKHKNATTDASI